MTLVYFILLVVRLIDTVDKRNKQDQVQRQVRKKTLEYSKKRAREIGAVGDEMNSPVKRACARLVGGMRDKTNEDGTMVRKSHCYTFI